MSNGQLRELTRVGVEFGSHTANHPKLYGADAQTIRRELRQSRKDISEAIDLDVDLFSYRLPSRRTTAASCGCWSRS